MNSMSDTTIEISREGITANGYVTILVVIGFVICFLFYIDHKYPHIKRNVKRKITRRKK